MNAAFFAATAPCRVRRTKKHSVNKNHKRIVTTGNGPHKTPPSIVSLNHRLIDTMKQWTNDSINEDTETIRLQISCRMGIPGGNLAFMGAQAGIVAR